MKFIVLINDGIGVRYKTINAQSYKEALFLARIKYPEFDVKDDVFIECDGLKKWFSERGVFL